MTPGKAWPRPFSGRCYLVGGGPSLRAFDFRKLDGRPVLAVNRAFERLPGAQVVYWSDPEFWLWHGEALAGHSGLKVTTDGLGPREGVTEIARTGLDGLETAAFAVRHGCNSGYAALNLAVLMGAREIVLLGLDMRDAADGADHWHDGYPAPRKMTYEAIRPHFRTLVQPLRRLGIAVWNTEGSAIDAFPIVPLEVLP